MRQLKLQPTVERCARGATLFLFAAAALLPGCAFIRLPLPAVSAEVDIVEDVELPYNPSPIFDDPRLGVIGLEVPLPYLCNLADVETIARAYLEQFEADELGELANNINIKRVYIEAILLTATEGDFQFIAEAGLRLINDDQTVTYWSEFPDRDSKQVMVLSPDADFDVFDLIPGDDQCATADLLYSGTIPTKEVIFDLDMQLRVEADWQF